MLGYLNIDFSQWSFVFKNSSLKNEKKNPLWKADSFIFCRPSKGNCFTNKVSAFLKTCFLVPVLFRNFLFGNNHILHCFKKIFNSIYFFWHQMHGFKFGPLIFLPTAEEMGEKSLSVSIIISAMAFD